MEILRIAAKLILFFLVDVVSLAFHPHRKRRNHRLLIIRSDGALGDYLLFRNFLKLIKESPRYKDYDIWLCADKSWIDLSRDLDRDVVSGYIAVRRTAIIRDIRHRHSILRQLADVQAEIAFYPAFRRDFFRGDTLVRASRATERIACSAIDNQIGYEPARGTYVENPPWLLRLGDVFYSRFIHPSRDIKFEFDRNREIFSQFVGADLSISRPFVEINHSLPLDDFHPFVLIALGASHPIREWPLEKIEQWIHFILANTNLQIHIVGPPEKKRESDRLCLRVATPDRVINHTGDFELKELARHMARATLVLSNESGLAHLAAAINAPYICPSNGNHLGRFHPYPEEMATHGAYCYPFELKSLTPQDRLSLARFSPLSTEEVSFDEVRKATKRLLTQLHS